MRDPELWPDEAIEDRPHKRSRHLFVLSMAAIPWLIVAALVLLPGTEATTGGEAGADVLTMAPDGREPEGPATAAGATAQPGQHPGAPSGAIGVPGETHPKPAPRRNNPPAITRADEPARESLMATATVIARAWLTGVAPHLDVPGTTPTDPTSYAEHVAVEAIDRPGDDLAVATVLAVLLREAPQGLQAHTRRIAVPLSLAEGEVRPAGSPWWLPSPELRPMELSTQQETDPAWLAAATDGLDRAGLRDVEVRSLERSDGWPWRAHVIARTSDGELLDGPLWLRWSGESFSLAGHMPTAAPDEEGADPAAEEPGAADDDARPRSGESRQATGAPESQPEGESQVEGAQ